MAKKIEINENWEPVEVEDLDNLFIVVFKHGSFDQGYVEAFDTDDVLMQSAYDSLAKQYGDCGCDELTKIYLIKVPNTDQTVNMCNTGLFNGNCCDPHVIEATRDLFNRADCEQLSCWEGCGLTENKKKKNKPYSSAYCGLTDPVLNIKHFNKCMGTGGLQNNDGNKALIIGDVLPNAPVADTESSDGASDAGSSDVGSSAGEGGAIGESLNEGKFTGKIVKLINDPKGKIKPGEDFSLSDLKYLFKSCSLTCKQHTTTEINLIVKFDNKGKVIEETENSYLVSIPCYFRKKEDRSQINPNPILFLVWAPKKDCVELTEESLNEDVTKELQIQDNENIEKDIEELEPPIDPEYFPNNMGINLSSVKKEIWVQQDDGQLKSIEVEFDPAENDEELKESFYDHFENEVVLEYKNLEIFAADLDKFINFGDFEFKVPADDVVEYLYDFELDLPEHEAKTEEDIFKYVEENLEQMVKKYDKELKDHYIEQAQEAAEHKYYEIRKAIKEKDFLALTEAYLDYSKQLDKMRQLEAGTRGFNASNASLEKILYNYDICISHNLPKARKVMEDALRLHGWDKYIKPTKKQVIITRYEYILDPGYVNTAAIKIVVNERNNPKYLIDTYGATISDILIVLVIALALKDATLATTIKDHIVNTYTITVNELKEFLNKGFNNSSFMAYLNNTIKAVCNESLTEETGYSHKLMDKFEVPPQIKLLDQNKVEDFIKKLAPEELFRVGYATPLYFYSELDDKFDLVKATEMEGYTGMDYRDANVGAADHDARVANAQRQIDTYADVLDTKSGHKLNKEGEKFSTTYRATNKLALNPEKSNEYIEYEKDADGNDIKDANGQRIIKTKIDMNKILFYPRVGSTPITHYYIDFHNGQGFRPIRREVLVDTLYKFILEVEKANEKNISKTDLMWIQKKGYGNIKKDSMAAVEAFYKDHPEHYAIWVYRKAEEANMPVEDYVKEHPHSPRWSMSDFRKKAKNLFDADAATIMAQDASTISGQELKKTVGASPELVGTTINRYFKSEDKPQVRALYSNQVYWLDGNPGKFGAQLKEGLEEDVQLDEAKRYVKRYYVRPLNIFCGNKEDIIQALIRAGDQNCSVYSLKNLSDHEDVHLLQPSDIIYYWDDRVLYDKNHVQVMDYDLFVKHEEDRKKVGNVDTMTDAAFSDMYDDRATEDDLKDKDVIANYKALNKITR